MGTIMHMNKKNRRNILEVSEEIVRILSKGGEYSVYEISDKSGSQWRTALKSLEFLQKLGLVKEKAGKKTYKKGRMFSLRK